MSFQPVLFGSGLTAWMTLSSTKARQMESFAQRSDVQRDVATFRDAMQETASVDELMDNYQVLRVALGAFDLSEDIGNRYFINRIMEEGTEDGSLASRMRDDRYQDLAENFSPASFVLGLTKFDSFSDDITDRYLEIAFEKAVGDQNPDLRLALGFQRTMPDVVDASTNDTAWFQVLANPPVKEVFQTIFGLPTQFGLLDIDQQHEIMKEKAEVHLGTSDLSELATDEQMEEMVRSFLLKKQAAEFSAASPLQTALSLVSAIPRTSVLDSLAST